MTAVAEIKDRLQETSAAIARLERQLTHESPPSLVANLKSLRRRERALEDDFIVASSRAGADVCTYRIAFDEEQPLIIGVARALADFQALFSVVYDALVHGPKGTAHVSGDASANTLLAFGYAFTGSLGVVMTLPNERLLFGETNIDLAMKVVLAMMKAERPEQIASFAQRLGVGPIRVMYQWAMDHTRSGLGASVEWRHHREVRAKVLVQEPEIRHLQQTLDAMGEETEEVVEVSGVLVAVDTRRHAFKFSLPDADDIRGTFARGVIGVEQTAEVPKRYKARLRKKTRVRYSTEKEEVTWLLERLEEL